MGDKTEMTVREREMLSVIAEVYGGRIATIEARIAKLEQRKTMADSLQGSWLAGKMYARDDIVQRNRKTWLALVETRARPGDSSDWRELSLGLERA